MLNTEYGGNMLLRNICDHIPVRRGVTFPETRTFINTLWEPQKLKFKGIWGKFQCPFYCYIFLKQLRKISACKDPGSRLEPVTYQARNICANRSTVFHFARKVRALPWSLINLLNAELNPICHLLALAGPRHFVHVSRLRVKNPDPLYTSFLRTPNQYSVMHE